MPFLVRIVWDQGYGHYKCALFDDTFTMPLAVGHKIQYQIGEKKFRFRVEGIVHKPTPQHGRYIEAVVASCEDLRVSEIINLMEKDGSGWELVKF